MPIPAPFAPRPQAKLTTPSAPKICIDSDCMEMTVARCLADMRSCIRVDMCGVATPSPTKITR